jgi:hypothetical protein
VKRDGFRHVSRFISHPSYLIPQKEVAVAKSLCKMKKSLRIDLTEYMLHVNNPTHVCTKCGRVANQKKLLCSPKKMTV